MTTCKSCGAYVVWAVTEKGKKMPVDYKPTLDGNIILIHKEVCEPPIARYERKEEKAERMKLDSKANLAACVAFTSHFASCPHAKSWRKK